MDINLEGLGHITEHAAKNATEKYRIAENVPDYKDFFKPAFEQLEPGTKLVWNWHIDYLCDRLQEEMERIHRGEPKDRDIIINIMPRSLKSYLVTVILNAWTWAKFPEIRFITLSYANPLSVEHSDKTRRLIFSDWYQDNFGQAFNILKSQNTKSYFINDKGGERKASSVGGQLTGSGGNVLIFDDPVKPPKKGEIAVSETELLSANEWHDSTAFNRVNDPVVDLRLYVMQRLHNNDMTGHLLGKENENYEHICIPGELTEDVKPFFLREHYEHDDEHPETGLFFKKRFPKRVLLSYEENMGDNYSGQVNQNPTTKGSGNWKEEYFQMITADDLPVQRHKSGTGWDLATSKKQKKGNSASAYVHGFRFQQDIYVTDCDFMWKEFPEMVDFIKTKPAPHWIENKSAGKQAVPTLKRDNIDAKEYPNENLDKFQHAAFTSRKVKNLNVYVLDTIWDKLLHSKKQGICQFPSAVWDDLHDAFCIFINQITEGMVSSEDIKAMTETNNKISRSQKKSRGGGSGSFNGMRGSFSGNSI